MQPVINKNDNDSAIIRDVEIPHFNVLEFLKEDFGTECVILVKFVPQLLS